jgi:hypothetical protein
MKKNTNPNPNQRIDAPTISQAASTLKDRKKIVSLLREKPTHTLQFREKHSLISPAPRIKELRDKGYEIETLKIRAQATNGRWHNNIALYTLISEPPANDQDIEVAA